MADVRSALVRLRCAEGRLKRAYDLSEVVAVDATKINLFMATTRDLSSVRDKFEADCVLVEVAAGEIPDFDPAAHAERLATFEEQYFAVMAVVEALTESKTAAQSSNSQLSKPKVVLPKITLPTYDGNPREWSNFSNLFVTLVTRNSEISSVEKFAYLKSALSGEPLGMVQALPVTEANFDVACKLLIGRYENQRLIATMHVEALLQAPSASADSPMSLRKFSAVVSENIAALRAIGAPVDHWDLIMLPILCKRLDAAVQTQWELSVSDDKPTLKGFLAFLEKTCRAQEAVAWSHTKASGSKTAQQTNRSLPHGRQTRGHSVSLVTSSPVCCICHGPHHIYKCSKFLDCNPKGRYSAVKEHKLCLNCLASSHQSKHCPSKSSCRQCGARHHSLLHFEKNPSEPTDTGSASGANSQPTGDNAAIVSALTPLSSKCSATVLLCTAQVHILDSSGTPFVARALLDTASQASFITEHCLQKLRLNRKQVHLPIHGLSGTPVSLAKSYTSVTITPVGCPDSQFVVDVFVLPRITNSLPGIKLSAEVRKSVSHLKLADPSFDIPGPIDMLIGADLFPQLVTGGKMAGPPVALNSVFGWILMGQVKTEVPKQDLSSFCISLLTSHPPVEDIVRKCWELEDYPSKEHISPEHSRCEQLYVDTHSRDNTGRYSVSLPFRELCPELGSSRPQAVHRLLRLERRLKGDPVLRSMYGDFMSDYLDKGHMERIPEHHISSSPAYYIPHHCVVKPHSSTTKLRVVFDASAKSSTGTSLNDLLLTGPKLQRDVPELLLHFRLHEVVFTADVQQMYRQILVHPAHQDYQRIVWRKNDTEPIQDFRLKTVSYGVSSAPFLALRTLQQLAEDEKEHFPTAARVLLSDVYVDDVVTGAHSVKSALAIQKELVNLLAKGGFKLRKFVSNHRALLDCLHPDDVDIQQPFSWDRDQVVAAKVLGLQWNPISDVFSYQLQTSSSTPTKRHLLSNIARIFDPLGWLTPLLMFAKHLIQLLWLTNLDWDSEAPPAIVSKWNLFHGELPLLSSLTIPRLIKGSPDCAYELHGFADSSEIGYAAVVYLRVVAPDGHAYTQLLLGKSKVAPVKTQSLPRLELCGALLLARLLNHVLSVYSEEFHFVSVMAWTDSQVALSWILSSPHTLKTFVANRVSEIQELTTPSWWRHIRSEDNPADCGSRGLLPSQLLHHHLWWTGPSWLKEHVALWPQHVFDNDVSDQVSLESKAVVLGNFVHADAFDTLLLRFGRLNRLLRTTAYILRYVFNCRASLTARLTGHLSPCELDKAMQVWLLQVQSHAFKQDLAALQQGRRTSFQLRSLVPFIDSAGVLRVGGRLSKSELPFEQKHPALLPKSHPLTDLIIRHYHTENHHPGIQTLQSILRERFWILNDKRAITRCLRHCVPCFRSRPSSTTPQMGDLPAMRVQQVKPFAKTGVDYAGPLMTKMARVRKAATLKAYMCVFVCCATKAVHVELASDLSTEVFLAAYKRFIARRGRVSDVYSDCGTNFVGAHNEMRDLATLLTSSTHQKAVTDTLSSFGVTWHFIPPAAPHFGGLWEAGVKAFKTHLRRVIGEQVLTFEELYTVLVQVEATLNSRPLCPLSNDPKDLGALTPGHFLTLEPLVTLPEPSLADIQLNRLQRWQLVTRLNQDFWRRWSRDYLHTLQQRRKWQQKTPHLVPGQLVLVKEERLPPLQWRLGRIEVLHPGTDGVPRVATVRTITGTLKRPVVKLCPLPIDN